MRVLWAINDGTNYVAVNQYLSARFKANETDIDILVCNHEKPTRQCDIDNEKSTLEKIKQDLIQRNGFRTVMVHWSNLDLVNAVEKARNKLRSNIAVVEAQEKRNLLTAFGANSVSRKLFNRAGCSVELIKPCATQSMQEFEVCIPIAAEKIHDFPFEKVIEMNFQAGTRLRLLAVIPPAIEQNQLEANPATVLRALKSVEITTLYVEQKLSAACLNMAELAGTDLDIDFDILKGGTNDVVTKICSNPRTSLVLIAGNTNDNTFYQSLSAFSAAAVAISIPCSVLYLATPNRSRLRRDAATILTMP